MFIKIFRKAWFLFRVLSYKTREFFVFQSSGRNETFRKIYSLNYWNDSESVSGFGSTLKYTEVIRREIPQVVHKYNIKSIFDAPCGDFNWMRYVLSDVSVDYIGADIVPELVAENNQKYGSDRISFVVCDIVSDRLPVCDLMICRDCLFHLEESDIKAFFQSFATSQIRYILTTTHVNEGTFTNVDIRTGAFRRLDLFSPPYNLADNVKHRMADFIEPEPPRELVLVTRDVIQQMVDTWK